MIYLTWDPVAMRCDWSATGNPLETAILLALFTDLAATPDYVSLDGDPRGHWSDAYTAQRALQPLIDAGVASAIDVTAQKQGALGQLCAMSITVTAPNNVVSVFLYAWAWKGI